ncbi:MAG: low molecular weight phosphotyrosine protein phosphatase [Proteobacteria bacterium]|nr:low molecular weight phosphotyrosine protein phosphatase [Pseudomonadota bacterium]
MKIQAQEQVTIHVLMVCLGNICRSPTAHGVMVKCIENKGLSDYIKVDSAGTGDYHIGASPDRRAIEVAAARGYSLQAFKARQVEASDYPRFNYILAMDRTNLKELRARCPRAHLPKLQLLLDYGQSSHESVPDPYYSGAAGFQLVLDLVEEACERLLEHICHQHFPAPRAQ